jgi:hypothetical protein
MNFSSTTNLKRIDSYEAAHAHFTSTPIPGKPGSVLRASWEEDERPIGTKLQHHYRIKSGEGCYDVILYNTTMARFHRPDTDGTYTVQYCHDSRTTSKAFVWDVLHRGSTTHTYTDTSDAKRCVPIAYLFNTVLCFTPEGRLIVKHSTHAQIYNNVKSEEHKKALAQFRANVMPLLELLELTVADTLRDYTPDYRKGRPFSSAVHSPLPRWWDGDVSKLQPVDIEHIREGYSDCVEHLCNVREYKARSNKPYEPPTPKECTQSMLRALLMARPLFTVPLIKRPLPMFPYLEQLPRKWVF